MSLSSSVLNLADSEFAPDLRKAGVKRGHWASQPGQCNAVGGTPKTSGLIRGHLTATRAAAKGESAAAGTENGVRRMDEYTALPPAARKLTLHHSHNCDCATG